MNIFAVNDDPRIAALELPDKLIPKMIVESTQMLSTAHRVLDGDAGADAKLLYKKAYENHPSCVWVREDAMNYWWLWMHALALSEEYKWRFTDETGVAAHKTVPVIHHLQNLPVNIPANKDTSWEVLADLPLCMPDQYKESGSSGGHRQPPHNHQWYATASYQKFITQDKPYMQDVFKAYTRAIQKKKEYSGASDIDYPPQWVTRNATDEQRKHIDLHKLMNPESAI